MSDDKPRLAMTRQLRTLRACIVPHSGPKTRALPVSRRMSVPWKALASSTRASRAATSSSRGVSRY